MPDTAKYIIVRSQNKPRLGRPFGASLEMASLLPMEFSLSTEELSLRDLASVRRDPATKVIAEDIPLQLIAPTTRAGVHQLTEHDGGSDGDVTWGIRLVGAADSKFTGDGVRIAVLDTGIDSNHCAFMDIDLQARNFTHDPDSGDNNGHGTHCAATIFGRDVDGERIGIARGVRSVLIGKVLDRTGKGTTEGVIKAMMWAEESGAHLISMSLGFDFAALIARLEDSGYPSPSAISAAFEAYRANLRLFDALNDWFAARELVGRGSLVIAAAGNESNREASKPYRVFVTPPAAQARSISVAALGPSDTNGRSPTVAPFSNAGADVAGPGIGIRSALVGGGIVSLTGTSMAAPHACGVAALWGQRLLAESGRIRPSELRSVVIGAARFIAGFEPDDIGRGVVTAPQS